MIGETRLSRQLPLDLRHGEGLTRDDLVVTPANAAAASLIDRWPHWPSPVVVLAGPPGSGKSHMAAIWRARADAADVAPHEIGGAAMRLAEAGPVLIDGADAGSLDEDGLFHLINTVRSVGSHLLLTGRCRPSAWNVGLADLVSRLKAASLVEIEAPDDLLLSGVITKLFADRQIDIEPHVVDYLVRRIERSLVAAMEMVDRLDRAALERKSRITRALAAEMVAGQGGLGF